MKAEVSERLGFPSGKCHPEADRRVEAADNNCLRYWRRRKAGFEGSASWARRARLFGSDDAASGIL